jgi:recombination protein RecA
LVKSKTENYISDEDQMKLIAKLEKNFEPNFQAKPIQKIKTGIATLDYLFDGGITKGCAIQLVGAEHSGKTTLAMYLAKRLMDEMARPCLYLDFEGQLDPDWLWYNTGIDLDLHERLIENQDQLDFSNPEMRKLFYYFKGEGIEGMNAIRELNGSGGFSCIVIDSLPSMRFPNEEQAKYEKHLMASKASPQTRMIDTIEKQISGSDTVFIAINQYRANFKQWGPDKIIPGPWKLRHTTTYQMELKPFPASSRMIELNGENAGSLSFIKCTKNKRGRAWREGNLAFLFPGTEVGSGLSANYNNCKFIIDNGLVIKKGSWFMLDEEHKAKGEVNFIKMLSNEPELQKQIIDGFFELTEKKDEFREKMHSEDLTEIIKRGKIVW